jgi:putative transposase
MESLFGTVKSEWTHHRSYRTRDEARDNLFFYIEAFYAHRRLHSSIGHMSPESYELLYHNRSVIA